jgi:glycopeptide antibiotics resistance protein
MKLALNLFKNNIRPLFAVYVIAILLLSILPLNSGGSLNSINIVTFRGDYFFHALIFIPWMIFHPVSTLKIHFWLLIGLLFATSTEAIQYALPYRAFNINDMIANAIGILLGAVFAYISRWSARPVNNT